MSHEGGSERTQQRTVAELLAKYGDSSGEGAPRRRRRRADDVSDTAPQAIIDRVLSDSGEMAAIRDDQEAPERTSHRQARSGRRATPPAAPAPQAPPPGPAPVEPPPSRRGPRHDPPEPMTEQLPRVPPAARRRRPPEEPPADAQRRPLPAGPPEALDAPRRPDPRRGEPVDAPHRRGEPVDGHPGRHGESVDGPPTRRGEPVDGHPGRREPVDGPRGGFGEPVDGPPGRRGESVDGPRGGRGESVDGPPTRRGEPVDGPRGGRGEPLDGPPRRTVSDALEGTQRGLPPLDDFDPAESPTGRGGPLLPRRAPGTSRMPQRAPKPAPAQPSQQLPQPSQQLPIPQPAKPQSSQPLPKPGHQPSQALNKPPMATGAMPVPGQTAEVGRPLRPGDFPGDSSRTEVDPQAPPAEFLEEHEHFDDKAARRFEGYRAHDDLDSAPAEDDLDEFDDLEELDEEAEPAAEASPAKAWLTMVGQLALGVVGGAAVWLGFNWLWGFMPVAALVVAVLVIAGLVLIVRRIRRADDLNTTVLAVLVGLVVTVSPAMLLLIGR